MDRLSPSGVSIRRLILLITDFDTPGKRIIMVPETGKGEDEAMVSSDILVNLNSDIYVRNQFPDYVEAEIDSTDPLVPALNELFGQNLLVRRFLLPGAGTAPVRHLIQTMQFSPQNEDDRESVRMNEYNRSVVVLRSFA